MCPSREFGAALQELIMLKERWFCYLANLILMLAVHEFQGCQSRRWSSLVTPWSPEKNEDFLSAICLN